MVDVNRKIPIGTKIEPGDSQNRRGRPKLFDTDRVLDVAIKAYWHEGPANASLNSICVNANVSKPSVYRQFGSEDGLTCAALERYAGAVFAQMAEIVSGKDNFQTKLREIIRLVSYDERWEIGCLFVKMQADRNRLGAKTRLKIAELEIDYLNLCRKFLEEFFKGHELVNGITIELAAQYLSIQISQAYTLRAAGNHSDYVYSIMRLSLDSFINAEF